MALCIQWLLGSCWGLPGRKGCSPPFPGGNAAACNEVSWWFEQPSVGLPRSPSSSGGRLSRVPLPQKAAPPFPSPRDSVLPPPTMVARGNLTSCQCCIAASGQWGAGGVATRAVGSCRLHCTALWHFYDTSESLIPLELEGSGLSPQTHGGTCFRGCKRDVLVACPSCVSPTLYALVTRLFPSRVLVFTHVESCECLQILPRLLLRSEIAHIPEACLETASRPFRDGSLQFIIVTRVRGQVFILATGELWNAIRGHLRQARIPFNQVLNATWKGLATCVLSLSTGIVGPKVLRMSGLKILQLTSVEWKAAGVRHSDDRISMGTALQRVLQRILNMGRTLSLLWNYLVVKNTRAGIIFCIFRGSIKLFLSK